MSLTFDQAVLDRYLELMIKDPLHRYWSWDFCFNTFSETNKTNNLSLHLGFYLASWGMYRGSGGLLQKNHLIHEKAVEIICSDQYAPIRCSPSQEVNRSLIPLILNLKEMVGVHYRSLNFTRGGRTKLLSDTDTLLSKILLGTTGCVPAYDRYFITGMKKGNMSSGKFTSDSLNKLFDFISANEKLIRVSQDIIRNKTGHHYPIMKVIDMFFWQIGYDNG